MNPASADFLPGSGQNALSTRGVLAELHLRQRRIGTSEEAADDYPRVRELVRLLGNGLTVAALLGKARAGSGAASNHPAT